MRLREKRIFNRYCEKSKFGIIYFYLIFEQLLMRSALFIEYLFYIKDLYDNDKQVQNCEREFDLHDRKRL